MLSTLRHKVLMVRRVRLGGVRLGDLAPGGLRPLTAAEVASFPVPAPGSAARNRATCGRATTAGAGALSGQATADFGNLISWLKSGI